MVAGGDQDVLQAPREAEKTADPTHHPMVGSDSIWWLVSVAGVDILPKGTFSSWISFLYGTFSS